MASKVARTIQKRCSVCNGQMDIEVLPSGRYSGGYYFGKMKLPVAKDHSADRVFGRYATDPVDEKREFEYWECNSCYERQEEKRKARR